MKIVEVIKISRIERIEMSRNDHVTIMLNDIKENGDSEKEQTRGRSRRRSRSRSPSVSRNVIDKVTHDELPPGNKSLKLMKIFDHFKLATDADE